MRLIEADTGSPMEPFVEPEVRQVSPDGQVSAIVEALQQEGMTGVVFRAEILWRYPEHCWMFGFEPLPENLLFEALAKHVKRVRRHVHGQKVTGYVIPTPGLALKIVPTPETSLAKSGSGHVSSSVAAAQVCVTNKAFAMSRAKRRRAA